MGPVICVRNPLANDGTGNRLQERLLAVLHDAGYDCRVVAIDRAGTWEVDLQRALHDAPEALAVVGVGGDGTHNAIINALKRLNGDPRHLLPPYLPAGGGTGNDLVKALGVPDRLWEPSRFAGILREGRQRPFDLGLWGERYFADAFCLGFDASTLATRDLLNRRWRGRLMGLLFRGYRLYALAAAKVVLAQAPWECEIRVDGASWYRGPMTSIVINNTPIHGGEFTVTPGAADDDGVLDCAVFGSRASYALGYLRSLRFLPTAPPRRRRVQGREFTLHVSPPSLVQVDGELFDAVSTATIRVVPGALQVRLPA